MSLPAKERPCLCKDPFSYAFTVAMTPGAAERGCLFFSSLLILTCITSTFEWEANVEICFYNFRQLRSSKRGGGGDYVNQSGY